MGSALPGPGMPRLKIQTPHGLLPLPEVRPDGEKLLCGK